jgi:hypothetical protein
MAAREEGDTKQRKWRPKFDYHVDYNDHFETPLVAYQDLLPLLEAVQKGKKERKDQVLYDPYYCNGRTAVYLRQLGFEHVVHAKRDFYQDIADQSVPQHDALITNPPYSDTHKERCLEFCAQQFRAHRIPFLLLMPNYVAARSYYRRILGDAVKDVAYLIPSHPYEYDHPEGTGHEISPFASLWFCGIGRETIVQFQETRRKHAGDSAHLASFVASLEELESRRAIPTGKRPNPRQRKKRKAVAISAGQIEKHASPPPNNVASKASSSTVKKHHKSKKNSKHRDESGKRVKERF